VVHPDDTEPGRATVRGQASTFTWSRLIASESPAEALEELALWLGAGTAELVLESTVASTGCIADWRSARPPRGPLRRSSRIVRGEPIWRLIVSGLEQVPSAGLIDRAVVAFEAWREAQLERLRAEARFAARTRELDVLQSLGQRAAEANSPYDLFAAAVETLQRGDDLDLALATYSLDGTSEAFAFQSRPFESSSLDRLVARAGELLGWSSDALPEARLVELTNFDPARGMRSDFDDDQLVVLPILRRDTAVACLLVVPSLRADEGGLRLLYSAANQLCLHFDRILTVREAEADRFRATLDSMPQAVVLADHDLRIVQLNRSARRLLEELELRTTGHLGKALERLELGELVDGVLAGRSREVEGEVCVGTDRMFNVTVTPLAGRRADERWMVLVLSEVTERRRLQQQLAHSEKMSSLGQMISGIAHELNNPLTSILGYAQLLSSTSDPARVSQRVEVLAREAGRCQRIVQNLLSFARRRRPEREALSLNQVIQSVQALLAYQLRVEDIRVGTELSPDLPAIHADPHELQQVLVNLMTNAQQAIRRGGGGGEIGVRTSLAADGSVVMDLLDSGPGIPDEIRAKIFDPFFTTKEEGKGTGLGLSLVYGIVGSHGGTIEALPRSGAGAHFRMTLPPGAAMRTAVAEAPPRSRPREVRPGRILVVDDEPELARLICEALAEDGHRTVSVADGHEALARIRAEEFELIISDVKMPGMGGERLHDELRRHRADLARCLLLTSGDTVGDGAQETAERTGLPLLHKPFDVERLRRVVRERLAVARDGAGDGEA